jgi:predicted RNA-binding Zn ribbon-like protein
MKNESASAGPAEDRDGFRFRGGSAALDLTATLQARRSAAPRELLATPGDLDRWLVSARLASAPPGASGADLQAARTLREAVFTLAAGLDAPSLDAEACAVLNRIAAGPPAAPALSPDGKVSLQGSAQNLLAALAQDAVRLFGADAGRIRQCESDACSIFFVDTSRSGRRRWCSMAACGNKAKVAALRSRARSAGASG